MVKLDVSLSVMLSGSVATGVWQADQAIAKDAIPSDIWRQSMCLKQHLSVFLTGSDTACVQVDGNI